MPRYAHAACRPSGAHAHEGVLTTPAGGPLTRQPLLRELCGAAARRQPVDFGDLGRFEPEGGAPAARFRPASVHGAFGGGRRD